MCFPGKLSLKHTCLDGVLSLSRNRKETLEVALVFLLACWNNFCDDTDNGGDTASALSVLGSHHLRHALVDSMRGRIMYYLYIQQAQVTLLSRWLFCWLGAHNVSCLLPWVFAACCCSWGACDVPRCCWPVSVCQGPVLNALCTYVGNPANSAW